MAQSSSKELRPRCRNRSGHLLLASLFLCGVLAACNNTCITFTSSPPSGTGGIKVGNPAPSCTLPKATGTVRVEIHAIQPSDATSVSDRIQHIFVSIRGIEIHPGTIADDASPDWQELAPELTKQPLQIDLMRGAAPPGAREPFGERVVIPAGVYRQVRLRFLANQPSTDDRLPGKSACGSAGFNCVVMADGRVEPLLFDGAAPEFRITSERIEGGSLFIPPDADTDLVIEFNASWVLVSSAGEGVRLRPTLTGKAGVGLQRP
jgi:hypothetical protein